MSTVAARLHGVICTDSICPSLLQYLLHFPCNQLKLHFIILIASVIWDRWSASLTLPALRPRLLRHSSPSQPLSTKEKPSSPDLHQDDLMTYIQHARTDL